MNIILYDNFLSKIEDEIAIRKKRLIQAREDSDPDLVHALHYEIKGLECSQQAAKDVAFNHDMGNSFDG